MKQRLVLVSADAMVDADIALMKTLPNFRRLMRRGSGIEHVRTIYPTVTYPAHTSMVTGCYPRRHGVLSNEELTVGAPTQPWCWFHRSVKVPDLFDAAKGAGLSTAAVFWPVTGCHPSIDYLIDEYWQQNEQESLIDAFRRAGSSEEVIERIIRPNLQGSRMRFHPEADAMGARFAAAMIREFRPDVLLFHPADIDGMRHSYGLFNDHVDQALKDTDRYLGMLMDAAEDAGVYDETNFVLMSDHGQMHIDRVMHLNVVLADHGLIRLDGEGNVTDWDAFSHSAGMCTYVYLKPGADRELRDRVYALLRHLAEEGIYGISRVFTEEEICSQEGLGGDFAFIAETDGYTSFGQRVTRPMVTGFDTQDYRYGHATHGYLPDKGPQPVFYAAGPGIREGVFLDRCPIVDIPVTLAKLLGTELKNADGRVLSELLR